MRWAVLLLASCLLGCFSRKRCESEQVCPPPEEPSCEGVCAPFVGGGWYPVLAASASPRPRCPDVAPVPAMSTTTVTACGVQEDDGACESDALVCLRGEPGWTACVTRDGSHDCPMFYEDLVSREDGVTLCCPSEEPPL